MTREDGPEAVVNPVRSAHAQTAGSMIDTATERGEPSMRLCFVVDGRSPIAVNWIRYFVAHGWDVHVISTHECDGQALRGARVYVVEGPMSSTAVKARLTPTADTGRAWRWMLQGLRTSLSEARWWLGTLTLRKASEEIRRLVGRIQPDVVHAMRIPMEGILAARALEGSRRPLVISVWGNDFTLFARRYPLLGRETRAAMERATGLHPDCWRDLELARAWGFATDKPALVAPSGGGVQREEFSPGLPDAARLRQFGLVPDGGYVVNPRGVRRYVRNDTFLRAIPAVLRARPETRFVGVAMAGDALVEGLVQQLGIGNAMTLLPAVGRSAMSALFRASRVLVSPATHDGTPNSLLEGMACGTFPVVSDLASIREWIEPGRNGLLFRACDVEALAGCVIQALNDDGLRRRALEINQALIEERASHGHVMRRASEFYRLVAGSARKREA